jgi:cyclophilin family peptidyl-prolyl cis-trans isomerase
MFGSSLRRLSRLQRAAGAAPQDLLEPLEQRAMLAATILDGQAIADQLRPVNSGPLVIPLAGRAINDLSNITGSIVYFDYVGFGRVFVEMFDALPAQADANRTRTTPQNVSNFFSYIAQNRYQNTIVNRSIPGFIIQSGGFTRPNVDNALPTPIQTSPAVQGEPGNKNVRGTIAMALTGSPDSGTSQFFFNLVDNAFLDIDRGAQGGGPFTAFGKVVGNGMQIIDQIAGTPRFNANTFYGLQQNDSRFRDLPLRNFTTSPIRPENFVTTSNIVRDQTLEAISEISATARSSNASLASASVDNNGNLVINLGTNRTGSATITVKYLAADGTFVEDSFVLNVLGTPVVGTLSITPKVLPNAGQNFKLTAGGVAGRGASITLVEFYVDGDGNGVFDANLDVLLGTDNNPQGGYSLTFPTFFDGNPSNLWDPGTYAFFVRAKDSADQWSNVVTVDGRINERPVINTFTGAPNPVSRLSPLTFTLDATDDTRIRTLEIFSDTNGDGEFTAGIDKRLGNAKRQGTSNTWLLTASTRGQRAGTVSFFARATDENKGVSLIAETLVTINNLAPTLASARITPVIISALNGAFRVTASGAKDLDGKINLFQVFYDVNGDNAVDGGDLLLGEDALASGGWRIDAIASAANNFVVGANKLLARVRDTDNAFSTAVLVNAVVNAAPTFGTVTFTPNPIDRLLKFGASVANVADTDGTVSRVELIWSPTNNPAPGVGDRTLGRAKLDILSGNWVFANLSASRFTAGQNTFFIRVIDNNGGATVQSFLIQVV